MQNKPYLVISLCFFLFFSFFLSFYSFFSSLFFPTESYFKIACLGCGETVNTTNLIRYVLEDIYKLEESRIKRKRKPAGRRRKKTKAAIGGGTEEVFDNGLSGPSHDTEVVGTMEDVDTVPSTVEDEDGADADDEGVDEDMGMKEITLDPSLTRFKRQLVNHDGVMIWRLRNESEDVVLLSDMSDEGNVKVRGH